MAYGVTTRLAHMDALTGVPAPGEIDWGAIRGWQGGGAPAFAGRYFLGTPTAQEATDDVGFCLWAHGEGTDPATPMAVAPIQRSDPARQAAVGDAGATFGAEDAHAIATYVQRCFDVGDLALPVDGFVLVWLEVDAGTNLSFDYWSNWAHILRATLLGPPGGRLVRPLMPGIACAFEQAGPQAPFLPAAAVRTCLSNPAPPGRNNLCRGLWCQTVLANPVFGEFEQDPVQGRIPIRYRRTFDGRGGTPISPGTPAAVLPTLPLITVDEPVAAADAEDSTRYMLEPLPWDPGAEPPPDTATPPANLPTQLGFDTAWRRTPATGESERRRRIQCVATHDIVLRRLPAGFGGLHLGTEFTGANALHPRRPTFFARYLDDHFNALTRTEAIDIADNGMEVCSVWQMGRDMVDGSGHAVRAFNAAEAIGQPPYTPVYFAVDVSVGPPPRIPLSQVETYFHDVNRGYHQYRAAGGAVPYYVGCYAAHNVLDAVYRGGLATHFWQPWPR